LLQYAALLRASVPSTHGLDGANDVVLPLGLQGTGCVCGSAGAVAGAGSCWAACQGACSFAMILLPGLTDRLLSAWLLSPAGAES